MRNNILIFSFIAVLLTMSVQSQDVINMMDGKVLEGSIVEANPGFVEYTFTKKNGKQKKKKKDSRVMKLQIVLCSAHVADLQIWDRSPFKKKW